MKKIKILLFMLSFGIYTQAQQTTDCAGGNASGTGGSVSYSIGQIFYQYDSDITGNISQGVQHAYEVYSLGIFESNLNLNVSISPNPSTELLTITITESKSENLIFKLCDMQGKVIFSGDINSPHTTINMSRIPAAMYYVNIETTENQILQSFKIIKN
jgi:hypothetical protein